MNKGYIQHEEYHLIVDDRPIQVRDDNPSFQTNKISDKLCKLSAIVFSLVIITIFSLFSRKSKMDV